VGFSPGTSSTSTGIHNANTTHRYDGCSTDSMVSIFENHRILSSEHPVGNPPRLAAKHRLKSRCPLCDPFLLHLKKKLIQEKAVEATKKNGKIFLLHSFA
jgi:hypothetical protein